MDEAAGAPLPRKGMIPRAENGKMIPHLVSRRKGAATEIAKQEEIPLATGK